MFLCTLLHTINQKFDCVMVLVWRLLFYSGSMMRWEKNPKQSIITARLPKVLSELYWRVFLELFSVWPHYKWFHSNKNDWWNQWSRSCWYFECIIQEGCWNIKPQPHQSQYECPGQETLWTDSNVVEVIALEILVELSESLSPMFFGIVSCPMNLSFFCINNPKYLPAQFPSVVTVPPTWRHTKTLHLQLKHYNPDHKCSHCFLHWKHISKLLTFISVIAWLP